MIFLPLGSIFYDLGKQDIVECNTTDPNVSLILEEQ